MSSDTGQQVDPEGAADAGGSAAGDAGPERDVEDLPLPPHPSTVSGPPQLYFLRIALNPIEFGQRMADADDVLRLWLPGPGEIVNLSHPDHAKKILVNERETFRKTEDFRIAFGEGLLTVEGEEWEQQRDLLQPLFRRRSVMGYADGMVEQIRRRSSRWDDGDRFDLQAELTDMTMDVLAATVLGRELALDGDRELREAAENLHDWFVPSSYVLPDWMPTPSRRNFKDAKRTIEQECQALLDEKSGDAPTDPSEAEDLLSLLVGLRESGMVEDTGMLTDERLRDQMVTILFAGHDTTTTALTFAFWAIANHDDVRERFHDEVDALDGPPTMDDVDDLEYTERVISETLRMFPPVHTLPRLTNEPVEFGGYRVPEDTRVHVPISTIQRDERWYDDPDEFRPERWADGTLRRELPADADAGTGAERHVGHVRQFAPEGAYMPFSAGPRVCIGRQFALLEAKLTLATIGREYDLYWIGENVDDDQPPRDPQMTLRMQEGNEFLVTER